jgi:hypothetical protein
MLPGRDIRREAANRSAATVDGGADDDDGRCIPTLWRCSVDSLPTVLLEDGDLAPSTTNR